MSNEALTWAFKQPLPTVRKFVLVALADYADESGSCFPSLGKTADRIGASERTVRRALRDLEADGYLRTVAHVRPNGSTTSNRYYLNLKGGPGQSDRGPGQSDRGPGQSDRGAPCASVPPLTPSSNPQVTNTGDEVALPLELEELKAKDAKTSTTSSRYSVEFEAWWARYPSKAGKVAAGKAFDKLVREGKTVGELDELLAGYLLGRQLAESRGEFVPTLPHAATWLNQEKWDDVERPTSPSSSTSATAGPELAQDDVDRILGRDYWTPPAPPAELDLLDAREWTRTRTAEHRAERARKATAALTATPTR